MLVSCSSMEDKNVELDKYVDMTLTQVKEILGEPNYVSEKNIDNTYLPTPVEPPYFAFFSDEELEKGVTIALARWVIDKGKNEILVWLKNDEGELTVFTSSKNPILKGRNVN